MIKRWLLYLVATLGCVVFLSAYQGWVAWILLLAVVLLPGFSLVISLLPMALVKVEAHIPGAVTMGEEIVLEVRLHSPLPLMPSECRYQVRHSLTGERLRLVPGEMLPTAHCGQLVCVSRGVFVYDLLGMFRLRKRLPAQTVLIRPVPVVCEPPRELERHLAHAWQPKYGGGFAENHELRLYRPGDGLNQVHWKLSAKTGKLIIREAMVPKYGKILLTAELAGTPEMLDRKLGQILWMGLHFLELGVQFELRTRTGSGVQLHRIVTREMLTEAMDALLCDCPAPEGTAAAEQSDAPWQYHIGGDAHEA